MDSVKPPFLRTEHNYDRNKASDEAGLDTGTKGGAKQSFKEECDINTIVERFGLGHQVMPGFKIPFEGDYTDIPDLHTAMNRVREANENFMRLPADIRAEFDNRPERFVAFATKDVNRAQLKEWGLLSPEALQREQTAAAQAQQQASGGGGGEPQTTAKTG